MNIEPRTEKSLTCKTWTSARPKVAKKSWHFAGKKNRADLPEIAPVIKMLPNGKLKSGETKIYRLGQYTGTLEEIKEFAAFKGIQFLQMGCLKVKTAA